MERGLELARARGHRYFATWFGAGLVMHQLELGEWDDAFVVGQEALREDVVTTPNGIAAALWLAKSSWERGDEARSRAWLERIPQDLVESTDRIRMAQGRFAQALDALLAHRLGEVVDYAQRAYGDMADGTAAVEPMLNFVADGALLLGDRSAAAHLAAVYEGLPEAITTRLIQANGERIVAFKAIADGDEGAAADAFARALAAAGATDAPTRSRPCSRTTARGSSSAAGHPRPSRSSTRHGPCGSTWAGLGGSSSSKAHDRRSRFRRELPFSSRLSSLNQAKSNSSIEASLRARAARACADLRRC